MKISSNRRKKILGLLALLLLLLGLAYYFSRPNLEAIAQELRAIREDANLTPEQKMEKTRGVFEKLSENQRRQLVQDELKKWHHERNAEMQKFLKMSPEEQKAYLKKRDEEKRVGPVMVKGGTAKAKGKAVTVGGGGSGGGFIFYGPGPTVHTDPGQMQKTMLDNGLSPETRAGSSYQRGLPR